MIQLHYIPPYSTQILTRNNAKTTHCTTWQNLTSPDITLSHLMHPSALHILIIPYPNILGGIAIAAAGRRSGATSCNAAAVKKKGVKVVHGKEIPWNLFSPKAPYQGKVIENDFHPQTLTEPTGDANWETAHVTFDHGGKAGCRMNQEDTASESLC